MFERSMHVDQTEAEWREAHEKANEWWHSTEAKRGAVEWLKAHYPASTWADPVHHRSFQVAVCRLNLTVAHYREYGHPDFTYDDLTRDNLADVLYYAGVESPLLTLPTDYSDFFHTAATAQPAILD